MNGLSETEKKIIGQILHTASELGYEMSVWAGEVWASHFGSGLPDTMRAIGTTDCTMISFRLPGLTPEGKRHKSAGAVFLVHGNDCDVIADHTDNLAMQTILGPATALANQLSEAHA